MAACFFFTDSGNRSIAHAAEAAPQAIAPVPRGETPEEAQRQSVGCVSCHTATDSASMHPGSTGDHWVRRLSWRRSKCDGGGRAEIGGIHCGDDEGARTAKVCRRCGAGRASYPGLHTLAAREPGVGPLRESGRPARRSADLRFVGLPHRRGPQRLDQHDDPWRDAVGGGAL